MREELKPCPFCGNNVEVRKDMYPRLHDSKRNGWHVVCWHCDLLFGFDEDYSGEFETQSEAIKKWNRRAYE